MSITTEVKWALPVDQANSNIIWNQGLSWQNLQTAPVEESIGTTEKTVLRFWVDQPSAQDWITFVQPFGPISATII